MQNRKKGVSEIQIKGVDISEMNGNVDFSTLKTAGIQFAIIRCGYGSDFPGQQDVEFLNNIQKAEAIEMPYGIYHYSYAKDAEGGKNEAAHVLRMIGSKKPAYGIWYDMEDDSTLGGDLAGAADAFCSRMEEAGLYCGVYANLNWFEHHLTSPIFDKYDRWCAQYYRECELSKPYGIWQYSQTGNIGGKIFDLNYAYKDYPSLTKQITSKAGSKSRVLKNIQNRVSRGFGNGHDGVDLCWDTDPNEPVIAHSDGAVTFLQTGYANDTASSGNASYGNCIKLKHPNGYATLYAHLSKAYVTGSQQVKKGQVIGLMGNTGNSFGEHLHFEVHDAGGTKVDPKAYLNADLPGLPTREENQEMFTYEQWLNYQKKYEAELAAKPASKWAEKAVERAKAEKLMLGDKDGKFRARSAVTREEAATIACNIADAAVNRILESIQQEK